MFLIGLLTLVHILILVYWLGGDLGAFYGSNFLMDPKRTVPERMMALKILNNIDMAPRTALILALPTGVALAWAKGWLSIPGWAPLTIAIACLAWLGLAWAVHLTHATGGILKRTDIAFRWIVLAALFSLGTAGLLNKVELPFFIACKMIVLGACISLGLVVRRQLGPLFPAIRTMNGTGPTEATDAAIQGVMARTRPVVVTLWLLLLVATYLGVATPV